MLRKTTERIGANIMGKRMFEQGERAWPEEAPFHTPVYVLTHEKREPWQRPGGTTFHFINDGPVRALALARESAGSRDIRIAGGADLIQQYLNLGVVDELEIALSPVVFGGGRLLFENLRSQDRSFALTGFLMAPTPHTCAMCVSEAIYNQLQERQAISWQTIRTPIATSVAASTEFSLACLASP